MPDFLPRRDADLLQWARNFDKKINADPGAYDLAPESTATFHLLFQSFADVLMLALAPGTRTGPSITAKDTARNTMKRSLRSLKGMICANSRVGDALRVGLGCKPRRVGKAPVISTPTEAPGMQIVGRDGSRVTVRLYDKTNIHRRHPANARSAMLWTYIGETPPAGTAGWRLCQGTTKPKNDLSVSADVPFGARFWIMSCWLSPTNQHGPMGTISTRIIDGAMAMPRGVA